MVGPPQIHDADTLEGDGDVEARGQIHGIDVKGPQEDGVGQAGLPVAHIRAGQVREDFGVRPVATMQAFLVELDGVLKLILYK